jgi:hypothetical protein
MIRTLIVSAALLVPAMASAQQVADLSQGRLEIQGTANPACVIRGPTAAVGNNMRFDPAGPSAGQIGITNFVDQNAVSRGGTINIALPVICNSAHRVVVRSANGGLRRQGAAVAVQGNQFAQSFPYQVTTQWGGQNGQLTTDQGGTLTINTSEARAGQLGLQISVAAGGRPLVAGTYSDQIVVELQAAN